MPKAVTTAAASSPDRMGFILCLAGALHAATILGIGFTRPEATRSAPRLEITLAQHQSQNDEADYLAQLDQAGSGSLDDKALLTKREDSPFRDNIASDPQQLRLRRSAQATAPERTVVTTTADSRAQRSAEDKKATTAEQKWPGDDQVTQLSQQIASLEAKLDIQRQAYAKRPRVHRLTSLSTKRAMDAQYLNHWRERVESVGNRHYPEKARRERIEGSLRMMVALLPDGSIREAKIMQSSGHPVLDQAALRIVHMAAPFDAFPPEMRREVDVLEIIRTWRFEKNTLISKE